MNDDRFGGKYLLVLRWNEKKNCCYCARNRKLNLTANPSIDATFDSSCLSLDNGSMTVYIKHLQILIFTSFTRHRNRVFFLHALRSAFCSLFAHIGKWAVMYMQGIEIKFVWKKIAGAQARHFCRFSLFLYAFFFFFWQLRILAEPFNPRRWPTSTPCDKISYQRGHNESMYKEPIKLCAAQRLAVQRVSIYPANLDARLAGRVCERNMNHNHNLC